MPTRLLSGYLKVAHFVVRTKVQAAAQTAERPGVPVALERLAAKAAAYTRRVAQPV